MYVVVLLQTGSADSASGGSGGSGMECMQVRSTPGPFHYLISEQAKSLVALQVGTTIPTTPSFCLYNQVKYRIAK